MPHGRWIDPSLRCRSVPTMLWHGSSSKSSFPEKYCSTFPWTELHTGPEQGKVYKGRQGNAVQLAPRFLGIIALVDQVSRRLQVFVDGGISLPLVHQPIANAELETKLFHIPVIGIEVLMVHHPWRHMHGVALIPIIAFAANL